MAMLKENTRELYNSTQDYWRIRIYSELDKNRINVILDCYAIKNGVPDTSLIADVRQYDIDLTVIGENLNTLATYTSIRDFLYTQIKSIDSYFSNTTEV